MLAKKFFYSYLFSPRAGALVRILTWVSVVGITLGVAAFIIVMSVMTGMHSNIRKRITGIEPHVMWSLKGVRSKQAIKSSLAYSEMSDLEIKRSGIYERHDLIIRTIDGIFRGVQARGWDDGSWSQMTSALKKQHSGGESGFMDWLDEDPPKPGQIYIGYDLARILGVIEGDPVHLIPPEGVLLPPGEVPEIETVTIGRIITTSLQDVDEGQIYFTRGKALTRFDDSPSKKVGMEIWVDDPFEMNHLVSKLELAGAQVTTWKDMNSSLFFALAIEKLTIGFLLGLSALISSFSIVIVLTLLLSQKKSDVAILMTMGLSSINTQKLFATVGMMLSGIGVLTGLVLGVIVASILEAFPIQILPSDIYYDSHLPSELQWGFVVTVFAIAIFVALASSYLPVRFLAQFRPVEILRR